jgi:hypothetical protein
MTPDDVRGQMAGLIHTRDQWLTATIPTIQAKAVWLTGSLGAGHGDAWSDLDMLPLAAKFIARGDQDNATAMATMLGTTPTVAGLTAVLEQVKGHETARACVARYLDVVSAFEEDSGADP